MTDTSISELQPSLWTREQLVTRLRGSRVFVRDLTSLMSHWPSGVHPEIERLDRDVNRTLES